MNRPCALVESQPPCSLTGPLSPHSPQGSPVLLGPAVPASASAPHIQMLYFHTSHAHSRATQDPPPLFPQFPLARRLNPTLSLVISLRWKSFLLLFFSSLFPSVHFPQLSSPSLLSAGSEASHVFLNPPPAPPFPTREVGVVEAKPHPPPSLSAASPTPTLSHKSCL